MIVLMPSVGPSGRPSRPLSGRLAVRRAVVASGRGAVGPWGRPAVRPWGRGASVVVCFCSNSARSIAAASISNPQCPHAGQMSSSSTKTCCSRTMFGPICQGNSSRVSTPRCFVRGCHCWQISLTTLVRRCCRARGRLLWTVWMFISEAH